MNRTRRLLSDGQLFAVLLMTALPRLLFLTTLNAASVLTETTLTALLSFVAFIIQKYVQGRAKKVLRTAVAMLLPVLFAGTVRELLRFAEKAAFHEAPLTVLLVMTAGAAVYAARMGTEALARFSFLVSIYAAAVLSAGIFFTIGKSGAEPLMWEWQPQWYRFLDCMSLPAVYYLLGENAGKRSGFALTAGVLVPTVVTGVYMTLSASLLGAAAALYHYPLFVLFQLCKGKSFSGLDMLYISLILSSVTAKGGVLLRLFYRELSGGKRCQRSSNG